LPWDAQVDDPVATIAAARAEHGDTFVVPTPSGEWWFVFDPIGVRSFYALEERVASKGVADWQMLRRKLPEELFLGRRTLPHDLFGRHATQHYLDQLRRAIEVSFHELGDTGVVDVFEWSRRLGHRMGFASWAGERPAIGHRFDELVAAFDELDGAAAFVDPAAMYAVAASDYAAERAALARIELLIGESITVRDASPPVDDLFGSIVDRWSDASPSDRARGIARDVVLVHLGSMSNLFAALGWTVVHLLLHDDVLERVRAEEPGLAERCAFESTRIAQRSLMSRAVLRPLELVTGLGAHLIAPPASIATLLPLTNTSAGPGLAHYDPDRWERRRLRDENGLAARELVATFGHGVHTCPAQPFSLAAIVAAATRLVGRYELVRRFDTARPRNGQIGGVARSATPCEVSYLRRSV
jgi:cytochrome P450